MHEEMGAHLDQAVARLKRRGLSPDAARNAARREFGNVAYLQEEARDARGGQWLETLGRDLRFAIRHFARTPITAITLVFVLALGIGVNAAIFSLIQSLTMRPAPGVPADDALVRIRGTSLVRAKGQVESRELSMLELNDLASRSTFVGVAGYARDEIVLDLGDGGDPRAYTGAFVTPSFFATLGIRPVIGAGLPVTSAADAPGAELALVLSHTLWAELGSDTTVVGRVVRLNGVPVRVVGVAPPAFRGPVQQSRPADVWLPIAARATIMRTTAYALASRDSTMFEAFARLAPNVTPEQASAVVQGVSQSWIPDQAPGTEPVTYGGDAVPMRGTTDVDDQQETAAMIAMLSTAALLVLLVACTNVSALLVGAAVGRRREIGIRLSLGASRRRVIRQLITESSLITLVGGALGLTLYWWITNLAAWALRNEGLGPDLGTVAYTAAIALGTGVVFGLSPALHATRLDVATALKDTGGGTSSRTRLQRVFIVAQIVLTQPLLVGLGMLIVMATSDLDAGTTDASAASVVRIQFATYDGGFGTPASKEARIADAMARVAELPGVESVVPQVDAFAVGELRVHPTDRGTGPRAEETIRTRLEGSAPGYFAFHRVPILRGREFAWSDTSGRNLAIVIASDMARSFWGAADPIGRRLQVTTQSATDQLTAIVIGVVDTSHAQLRGTGGVYTANGARWRKETFLVRTAGEGTKIFPAVREIARTRVPDIPIQADGLATLEQLDRLARTEVLQVSGAATSGGLLALLLASIGLYGVVALGVRQRRREIGVRIALGARPRQVIGIFFLSGVRLSLLGIILGLPLSIFALSYFATNFASEIPLNMPIIGGGIALMVVAVAALASWVPARRAAMVDPLATMRVD